MPNNVKATKMENFQIIQKHKIPVTKLKLFISSKLRENVNLPKNFDKIFTENFRLSPKQYRTHKTSIKILSNFFGRLTFSRKNGDIKDFSN